MGNIAQTRPQAIVLGFLAYARATRFKRSLRVAEAICCALSRWVRYTLSRWEGLTFFAGDGGIELLEAPPP
jgi:hypothetical protein